MYSFAVCDDEPEYLKFAAEEIRKAFALAGEKVAVELYARGEKLVRDIQAGREFQVLFLDIVMPETDGFEICRQIRVWESNTLVVFFSSNEELVFQSFRVQPFGFLRKKYLQSELQPLAGEILHKLRQIGGRQIMITEKQSGRNFVFRVNTVRYLEAQGRVCRIYLKNEDVGVRYPFRDIEQIFLPCGFIKIHRSYLVNYREIYRVDHLEVALGDGTRLPVSRDRIAEVKKEIMLWNRR